ncbi:hypothetical protein PAMA_005591 [Pampus argenteus]
MAGVSKRKLRIKPHHDAEKHIRLKTDKAGLRSEFVNSYKVLCIDDEGVQSCECPQFGGGRMCIYTSPLATPSADDNLSSSHHSVVPAMEALSPSENEIYTSPLATPSADDNLSSSHHSVVPAMEALSPSENETKEDKSTDESSHTDYSDVDYIPDTDGNDSDDSICLSTENALQKLYYKVTVTGNSPNEESSPDKDSSTENDHAVRKKKRLSFSPEKRKKCTEKSPRKKRSTPLYLEKESVSLEKDSSSTVSPETEKEKMPHSNEGEEASSDSADEEDEFTSTAMDQIPPSMDMPAPSEPPPAASLPIQEPAGKQRRKWEAGEVHAVEKHMMKFIRTFTLPAKRDCTLCLQLETLALKGRTWTDVKNYVRNRITAQKRQTSI